MIKLNKEDIINLINTNEKTYKGEFHNINYLYLAEKESNHLLVVLSGFNGKESMSKPASYNYIKTLNGTKINKLFILDSIDNVPVYYYGVNGQDNYLKDICRLISEKLKILNIDKRNLIIAGSSKGGSGALLIGFEMKAGHIISGANQLYVGNYLSSLSTNLQELIFTKILGEYNSKSKDKLDVLFKNKLLIKETSSNLYFHAGNQDTHYIKHMIPLLRHYDNNGILYELDLRNYVGHSNVGRFFPNYLIQKLSQITDLPHISSFNIDRNKNILTLRFSKNSYDEFDWAVYITDNNNHLEVIGYTKSYRILVKTSCENIKKIKVFLRQNKKIIDVQSYFNFNL